MGYNFRLYLRLISIQIRSQFQYRVSAWFETITSAISIGLFFLSIALVMQRFKTIGGWTLAEIAFLWGMVELAFGLMDMVFSGFDPDAFSPLVRRGTFDQFLLRPVDITLQIFGSRFVTRRLGRIFEGAVILAVALSQLEIQWTWVKILYLPVILISLILFFGGLFIIGSTLTFWTIQPIEAVNIFTYGGSEMMSYPMHIYPDWLVRFFTYVIPGIFLIYSPAVFILGKPDPLGLPMYTAFLSPIAGLTVLAAALLFWRFGVRHYQGTGS